MSIWAVVVAAGSGRRFGATKQVARLGDRRVVDHSVQTARDATDGVVLVAPADATWQVDGVTTVAGGATRSASVRAGLQAVPADAEIVVVHDAARPLAGPALFARVLDAVRRGADGAVPGLPIADTVKRVDPDGVVLETLARDGLFTIQTPQAFRAGVLRAAHASGAEGTDDAAVVERAGGRVVVVEGADDNFKITEPCDLERAAAILASRADR
ncbi:MAG: 2-C-methyl-D-erythritol 4-phosphate cytidylyltransferase [Acidimicrobiia bacterium]